MSRKAKIIKHLKKLAVSVTQSLSFSVRDLLRTLILLFSASILGLFLKFFRVSDFIIPLNFVLAVMLTSLWTDGYLFGIIAATVSVPIVNIVFTYPYYELNFSMAGYPLTYLCMFTISIVTSTLTSRIKENEKLRTNAIQEGMRANLLRAISHDFRTPLTSIIGSVNAVIENPDKISNDDRKRLLEDVADEAQWLINMVENLLSITRMDISGRPALHKEPQAVEEVLFEAVSRFRRQRPDYKVSIHVPNELLMISMDAMLIEQVIVNILLNSVIHGVYADRSGIDVYVKDDYAHFEIIDNGKGFDPEKLPHLLSGYGMSQSTSDSVRTMGIGLTVCNSIISAHGGRMYVSNYDNGARVIFSLPLDT